MGGSAAANGVGLYGSRRRGREPTGGTNPGPGPAADARAEAARLPRRGAAVRRARVPRRDPSRPADDAVGAAGELLLLAFQSPAGAVAEALAVLRPADPRLGSPPRHPPA